MLGPKELLEVPIALSANGAQILESRYLKKGVDGKVNENIPEMFWRVASHVAAATTSFPKEGMTQTELATEYYKLMTHMLFFPNSPTFTGAGTPLGQLAACFVLAISDDMGRDADSGIFSTLRNAALIQQTGGGIGFSFSRLRPKGDIVNSTGTASGPISFLKVYDNAVGAIAQGGCLAPNTLVFTNRGMLRLDEIVDPDQPGWQDHQNMSIPTDDGVRNSPRCFNNGVVPMLSVRTTDGLQLAGTPNHRVKVMTNDGPQWKQLDQLKVGEFIITILGAHHGTIQQLKQPQQLQSIKLPATLEADLAELVGLLHGSPFMQFEEGSYDNSLLKCVFPDYANDQGILHHNIKGFLIDNQLYLNQTQTIPSLIRQSPPSVCAAFLRGVFETSGVVHNGFPQLKTVTAQSAQEFSTLLIGLGIPNTITPGSMAPWCVEVQTAIGLKSWKRLIGCHQHSHLFPCMQHEVNVETDCTYPLPNPTWWLAPILRKPAIAKTLAPLLFQYATGECILTAGRYELLCGLIDGISETAQSLKSMWFTPVAKIEHIPNGLTLDLEVDGNHTYIANGMVTHNTRRGANMGVLRVDHPDIEEFINVKATEGVLTNFNLSVGLTDQFMKCVEGGLDYNLINPHSGLVIKTLSAQKVFGSIVAAAHRNGEPGVLFLDAANRTNPVPHKYTIEATNPCVSINTEISTTDGIQLVSGLIDIPFDAVLNGKSYHCMTGFFKTGTKHVFRLDTASGHHLELTADHRVLAMRGNDQRPIFVPADELTINDKIALDGPVVQTFAQFVSLTYWGEEDVYDCTIDDAHAFVANGIVVHNCGEQFLGPFESCCLGSINLAKFVIRPDAATPASVDWVKLAEVVALSVRFLDDVIDANKFVPAIPQLKIAAQQGRRIGLGIMGLADLCFAVRLRYGSPIMIDFVSKVMEFIKYHTMLTSIQLAKERGPFPSIKGSIYDPEHLTWKVPTPLYPPTHQFIQPLDWQRVVDGILQHGIRNCAQNTIAPTGTIGTVTGCEGYGCEPVFALAYTRHVKQADKIVDLTYVSPAVIEYLDALNLGPKLRQHIIDQMVASGSCQGIEELSQEVRNVFVVSGEVEAQDHIRVQAALQRYVDNSISKTINFPSTAQQRDVWDAYMNAWKLGCKGLTVYVTGSRDTVVLETAKAPPPPQPKEPIVVTELQSYSATPAPTSSTPPPQTPTPFLQKRSRPSFLHGATYRSETPLGEAFVTINSTEDGEPFEVFMNVGKGGSDVSAVSEAFGRLISLNLRMPSLLTPTERLHGMIHQLEGIGGRKVKRIGKDRITSLPDSIAKVLRDHLDLSSKQVIKSTPDAEEEEEDNGHHQQPTTPTSIRIPSQIGDLCGECGNSTLLNIEGCKKCHVCGYSEC